MVGWHHWLDGHEFEQAAGVDDGQGSLACCSSGGCKELDTTEWLKWLKSNNSKILMETQHTPCSQTFWGRRAKVKVAHSLASTYARNLQ